MPEAEDKAKAEKLAAAKKRVAQLQKQKAKKAVGKKKDEGDGTAAQDSVIETSKPEEKNDESEAVPAEVPEDQDEEEMQNEEDSTPPEIISQALHGRQASLSLQSKMRSSSFRRTSLSLQNPASPSHVAKSPILPPLSPEGDTVPDIYRKQAMRIEELEKENKRLEKEAKDGETRWRRSEEELEDIREGSAEIVELRSRAQQLEGKSKEVEKLKADIAALQRQNSQLQTNKSLKSPHPLQDSSSPDSISQLLTSKSTTIEAMELEISNLRAQLSSQLNGCESHSSQISALEQKLSRTELSLERTQRELTDAKHSLSRATEKAMKEGVDKTSSDTKMKSLEREAQESSHARVDAEKRIEVLEKKLAALGALQKENEARSLSKLKDSERIERDAELLRRKLAGLENENMRLREERDRHRKREISAPGDDGMDELEDEERLRLERRVRELEGEVYDLRRGAWKERRKELVERHGRDGEDGEEVVKTPGSAFDEVDLTGGFSPSRRRSSTGRQGPSFTNVLSSGFAALTGGNGGRGSLELLEDDEAFNEDAFRIAQEEEEARKRVEWVREQKRKLRDWEGWRMDLVETRRGIAGAGEVFGI